MNRMTFRTLTIAFALLTFLCLPSIASADGVTWDLSGVTFDDGGTATGSFVYDATTNTVSDINVTTTSGTAFGGANYTAEDPGSPAESMFLVFVPNGSLSDFTGTPFLALEFFAGLTNAGGVVPLIGEEDPCADPGCTTSVISYRMITTGEVVSVSTPEPASLLLLGVGLLGLALAPKRKMQRA